jgi:hypothetical protein
VPALARWLSVDPLHLTLADLPHFDNMSLDTSTRHYVYCNNRALTLLDPTGLLCKVCTVQPIYKLNRIDDLDAEIKSALVTKPKQVTFGHKTKTPYRFLAEYVRDFFNEQKNFGKFGIVFSQFRLTGVRTTLNRAIYEPEYRPQKLWRAGGYLFYVVFTFCEKPRDSGDCQLFLNERGSFGVQIPKGSLQFQNLTFGENKGNIMGSPNVAKAELRRPIYDCDHAMIYLDMPSNFAQLRDWPGTPGPYSGIKVTVQNLQMQDASRNDHAPVKDFRHIVTSVLLHTGSIGGWP